MSMLEAMGAVAAVLAVFVMILLKFIEVPRIRVKHTTVALTAILVGGVGALIAGAWMGQESPKGSAEALTMGAIVERTRGEGGSGEPPPSDSGSGGPTPATSPDDSLGTRTDPRKGRIATNPEVPIEFTLNNGEQKVLLGGEASVAIEFTSVGSMDVATLRIFGEDGNQTHALLGGGKQFEFKARGNQYFVSVTKLDFEARQVDFEIDRKIAR